MVVGGYHKKNTNTNRRTIVNKTEEKKIKFDLRLPAETFKKLHEIKDTEGPSVTFQINKAVEQYLENKTKEVSK